jgi:hypothetical protein
MQVTRNSLDTGAGPSDWFTGTVYIDTVATPYYSPGRPRPGLPKSGACCLLKSRPTARRRVPAQMFTGSVRSGA